MLCCLFCPINEEHSPVLETDGRKRVGSEEFKLGFTLGQSIWISLRFHYLMRHQHILVPSEVSLVCLTDTKVKWFERIVQVFCIFILDIILNILESFYSFHILSDLLTYFVALLLRCIDVQFYLKNLSLYHPIKYLGILVDVFPWWYEHSCFNYLSVNIYTVCWLILCQLHTN